MLVVLLFIFLVSTGHAQDHEINDTIKTVSITEKKLKREVLHTTNGKPKSFWSTTIFHNWKGRLGRYFPNSNKKTGFVDAIEIHITNTKAIENPFRVWLFANKNCLPDTLIAEGLLVTPHEKNGWQTIELDSLHLEMPENGFWAVIEILNDESYFMSEYVYSTQDTTITDSRIWKLKERNGRAAYVRGEKTGFRTVAPKDYHCTCVKQRYRHPDKGYYPWSSDFGANHAYHCPKIRAVVRW